jgi:integrase/recombinase XerD
MGEPEIAALQVYLGEPGARLLGRRRASPHVFISRRRAHITRQAFWKRLKMYVKQAGIAQPIWPHKVRHSFATHLLEGGADILSIVQWLGHQDLSTTEIYTRVHLEHLREAYQQYHPRA